MSRPNPTVAKAMTDGFTKSERLLREYLIRARLEISAIVLMAHDIPPWRWPHAGPQGASKVKPRYEALKAAASEGELGARLSYTRKLDHNALVSLHDLMGFLEQVGPEWDWLRSFVTRWQQCSRRSEVRKRRTTDPDQDIRDQIELVLRLGKELQHGDPSVNRMQIIERIAKSNQSKLSRETIRKIVYGTYPKMKLFQLSGLAKKA